MIEPALQPVLSGTAALGFTAGCLGTFAVLRRQSLLGDAVSHAALPGVVLAFLAVGKAPVILLIGAAISGLAAYLAVIVISGSTRIPFDTALAAALAVFFGAGLMCKSLSHAPAAAGIDRYLLGQAATLLWRDVALIIAAGSLTLAVLVLFWKEFALLTFDRSFAVGLGLPVAGLDALLTLLIVLSIVIGLESVGVVLMSALVVAPAAAARQWTHRLGLMTILAGILGAVSAAAGTLLSYRLSAPGRSVPTGPTIVITATAVVLVSFFYRLIRQRFPSIRDARTPGP